MTNRVVSIASLTLAVGLLTTLSALDIRRAKTEAQIGLAPSGAEAIQLNLRAELTNNGFPELTRQRVVVGWQTAGGIQPQPFRILIPAGCFVSNRGFHVEDFRGCGVQMALGRTVVAIVDFEARLRVRDDGSALLDLNGLFQVTPDDNHPALGTLGGSALLVAIGRESAISLPVSAETVSGVQPDPF